MRKHKSKYLLFILIGVALVISIIAVLLVNVILGNDKVYRGMNFEQSSKYSDYIDFEESDFGEYNECKFKAKVNSSILDRVGTTFTVTYTPEQYEAQLKELEKLDYLTEPLVDDRGNLVIPSPVIAKNDWYLRVVKDEESLYPNRFKMIVTNDEEKAIVYMTFCIKYLDTLASTDEDVTDEEMMINYITAITDFHFTPL